MSCRFPGAGTVEQFWRNLCEGVESIARVGDEPGRAGYVGARGVLDGIERFDANFFGLTPREAEITDPQHRVFLECAWEALESAACDPRRVRGRVGVYAGCGMNTYLLANLAAVQALAETVGPLPIVIGSDKDYLATRVSYKLDLHGPSVTVGTACSTSLVAVQMACQALLDYQCDMALAGGSTIQVPQEVGYVHQEGGITSPDGHCRAFDAAGNGTVFGNGVGVVALKRLSDALADRDPIHAVILGGAINNDGAAKVGYTAPSVAGQTEVIEEALALAGVAPETIGYVEAHGTGTALGDPIEIAALTRAFASATAPQSIAIGSVKTNVGHLDTSAGVAGLIKAVLALEHAMIPPSLHYERANRDIDFGKGPFHVAATLAKWSRHGGTPRRAGVSSFGIGGTNAHLVLEEASAPPPSDPAAGAQVLTLSAMTATALDAAAERLAAHLGTHPDSSLADVAYTLQTGRRAFAHRRAVVAHDLAGAMRSLRAPAAGGVAADRAVPVALLLSGQGSQVPGMARALYDDDPEFRAEVDRGAARAAPLVGADLRELLCADPADERAAARLAETALAQPALFVFSYALARRLLALGVRPAALLGHSVGEYVAACLSGVFTADDALALVAARGALMQRVPRGRMLAVPLAEAEVLPLLDGALSLAAVNGVAQCVVAGPEAAVAALRGRLRASGVETRELRTSHAFHSAMMEPVLDAFRARVATVPAGAPGIPVVSNVTGRWLGAGEAADPDYWTAHLRRTVRFADGLATLFAQHPELALVEIGPGSTLAQLALRHPARGPGHRVCVGEPAPLAGILGRLWVAGASIDWEAAHRGARRRRVRLPTYAFDRQRYWLDAAPVAPRATTAADAAASAPRGATTTGACFSVPTWARSIPPALGTDALAARRRWLLFVDERGVGRRLAERLVAAGQEVVSVGVDALDPDDATGYERALAAFGGPLPDTIVHLWGVSRETETQGDAHERRGVFSVLRLLQALGKHDVAQPIRLAVVTGGAHDVTGEEPLHPEKAMVSGLLGVLPRELLHAAVQSIDLGVAGGGDRAVERLLAEVTAPVADAVVAHRGIHRLVRRFEPIEVPRGTTRLRERGVYLITGGLGGVGLTIAQHLARTARARVVLTSRTAFPPREEWPRWLEEPRSDAQAAADAPRDMRALAPDIDAALDTIERALAISQVDAHDGLADELDRLCTAHVIEYFAAAGIALTGELDVVDLRRRLRLLPKFDPFLDFMLDVLAADGVVTRDGDRLVGHGRAWPPARGLRAALTARVPACAPLLDALAHCAAHYGAALSGDAEAIGVLFPDGGPGLLAEMARRGAELTNHRVYRLLLRETIGEALRRRPGRRLRILEVGGGNGLATGVLVPSLRDADVEYHFTDIGRSFVVAAERHARAHGFAGMTFGVLDVSRDPRAQGYDDASFDMIVALDVVHATPSIAATLGHLRRLLRPDGVLFLLESVRARRWDSLVDGLAEGWWYHDDPERRGAPFLSIARWEALLAAAGFASVTSYPRQEDRRRRTDAALIVAQTAAAGAPGGIAPPSETVARREQIEALLAIEAAGGEALVLRADVTDREAMRAAVAEARRAFGTIDGVIHAAMDMRSGALQLRDLDAARRELAPKVAGTRVLAELFADAPLDFLVLCSSTAAFAGGFGDGVYAAANAYLDAFAHAAARERRVVSVNWGRWESIGHARTWERWHARMAGQAPAPGLTAAQALDALERVLALDGVPQIVVTAEPRVDATAREDGTLPHPMRVHAARPGAPSRVATMSRAPRPSLATPYAPPAGETEEGVAAVWEDVLGTGGLGRDDHFGDLGGDSLIAVQVASRLAARFGVALGVRALFDAPTIAALAERIETLRWAAEPRAAGHTLESGDARDEEGVI
jgi:acyl transferase domain-containing protein